MEHYKINIHSILQYNILICKIRIQSFTNLPDLDERKSRSATTLDKTCQDKHQDSWQDLPILLTRPAKTNTKILDKAAKTHTKKLDKTCQDKHQNSWQYLPRHTPGHLTEPAKFLDKSCHVNPKTLEKPVKTNWRDLSRHSKKLDKTCQDSRQDLPSQMPKHSKKLSRQDKWKILFLVTNSDLAHLPPRTYK